MSNADQFRVYAEEAKRWARQAKFPETKQALFDLACTWTEAALCAEQRDVRYSNPGQLRITSTSKTNITSLPALAN
jgi:hypothetical protein